MSRSSTFVFDEHLFEVDRGVFDPVSHLSGVAFARWLEQREFTGQHVVEVGTGCGLLSFVVARTAALVVASDIDPRATRCAARNLRARDVDVRCGDLFSALGTERFDVLVTNPPYEIGRAHRPTLRSPDFLERLVDGWSEIADELLLAFPTDSLDLLDEVGFRGDLAARIPTPGRELGVFRAVTSPKFVRRTTSTVVERTENGEDESARQQV